MLREQIAASLEEAFSKYGFAEPSVAQLKTACNVSLRTLYKYYPSKEAMIVGALEYRHQRYLTFLLNESPSNGVESALYIFNKLEQWMKEYAPHGCLSMNAIAAFPDNPLINKAVKEHKEEVRQFLGQQSQREDLSTALFLLHEGVSSAWPVLGKEAITSAQKALLQLLEEDS
ncbi:conserved hypothetical protein [Shewanella sediminis HAW-EB3]|uniref:HTH tetR-type domain-containing protein n=1 Tax=Shewanella sediminis (strain HAW-EB3) TaxID=425104 RepID=A8FWG1_SHESH|nr:TetR/AcrR family transcriptional regulator [Shewanella sediminis]ABV37184.1 conserved hypothetical protein [Shewanella sediminis HAW-EB3]